MHGAKDVGNGGLAGDIQVPKRSAAPGRTNLLRQGLARFVQHIGDGHVRPFAGEQNAGRPANAKSPACYDCDFVFNSIHLCFAVST